MELRVGQLIGKCRVEGELGRGGMGTVYRAQHTTLDVPVAVKVVSAAQLASDPGYGERLMQEARLAAKLTHPNAVRVMDADRDPETGMVYVIQEFVAGGSLAGRLAKDGTLGEREAIAAISSAARALEAARQLGIVHRDIKPDNLLISAEGRVKVGDMGLAKQTGHTTTSTTMGTPSYMPPEQVTGLNVDHRSDIYSLGATLYHLMQGEPPYTGENVFAVLHQVTQATEPPPLEAASPGLQAIYRRMMASDPEARFQTAAEVVDSLKRLQQGATLVDFRQPTGAAPGGNQRDALIVAGGVGFALLVVLIMIFSRGGGDPAGASSSSRVVASSEPASGAPSSAVASSRASSMTESSASSPSASSASGVDWTAIREGVALAVEEGRVATVHRPQVAPRLRGGFAPLTDQLISQHLGDGVPFWALGGGPPGEAISVALRFRAAPQASAGTLFDVGASWPRRVRREPAGLGLLVGFNSAASQLDHWQLDPRDPRDVIWVGHWFMEACARATVRDGRWHRLLLVHRGRGASELYLDGQRLQLTLRRHGAHQRTPLAPRVGPLWIFGSCSFHGPDGVRSSDGILPMLRGRLDDIAVWRRALDADEIRSVAAAEDLVGRLYPR